MIVSMCFWTSKCVNYSLFQDIFFTKLREKSKEVKENGRKIHVPKDEENL